MLAINDEEMGTFILDGDGSNRVDTSMATCTQVSPADHVAKSIQVTGGGGDGNEASLLRQRISRVGGADKNSELSGKQLASYV